MKVDNTLLEKYYNGFCSKVEQDIVEKWLASNKFDNSNPLDLPTGESKEAHKKKIWQDISQSLPSTTVKIIPLYKKLTRYAAAACFIMGVFFAGRYSKINNTTIVAQEIAAKQKSHDLLVYGGNKAYAKIQGDTFNLQFDGRLKLYNSSTSVKTIKVSNVTYTLEPRQTYYLLGNNNKSTLIANNVRYDSAPEIFSVLKGDFSIKAYTA
ncbi:hypothetical protein Q4Q35_00435 [Flavivirga aquimarina]|uniref:FecR protein domain-containing protein n=1 Tax=Flavivirga aquimarina TaxID=2027862 RepID=A0ABT8W575_9FLAO|nr:hypothetical protein [Flavivirga aquimarina]MDO5968261.1 hypothetical protein [Flavivirga aquimarina]